MFPRNKSKHRTRGGDRILPLLSKPLFYLTTVLQDHNEQSGWRSSTKGVLTPETFTLWTLRLKSVFGVGVKSSNQEFKTSEYIETWIKHCSFSQANIYRSTSDQLWGHVFFLFTYFGLLIGVPSEGNCIIRNLLNVANSVEALLVVSCDDKSKNLVTLESECIRSKKTLLVFTFSYCMKQGLWLVLIPSKPQLTVTKKISWAK